MFSACRLTKVMLLVSMRLYTSPTSCLELGLMAVLLTCCGQRMRPTHSDYTRRTTTLRTQKMPFIGEQLLTVCPLLDLLLPALCIAILYKERKRLLILTLEGPRWLVITYWTFLVEEKCALRHDCVTRNHCQVVHPFGPGFDATFKNRLDEADDFYDGILPSEMLPEQRNVARQAYAGMCVLVARVSFLVLVRAIYEHNSSTLPPILLQVYCGASSSITTLWRHGWTETQISPNLLLRGKRAGTRTGNTSSTVMLSLCPTNGSTHGLARLPLFLCSLHFCV